MQKCRREQPTVTWHCQAGSDEIVSLKENELENDDGR